MSEKILFITGKLAERQLERILNSMKPEFKYKISQIGVNVAALMSESIIMRRVNNEQNFDRIIVPGKFRGSLKKLSNFFKIPVERGPDDVSDIPDYFGVKKPIEKLKDYDCKIFAEIVDAAILRPDDIRKIAKSYKKDGANVIDLGCMPDTKFEHLEDSIKAVKSIGCEVSVDSANSEELIRGSNAGADYILSINQKNIDILDKINSTPILIPNSPGDLDSLEKIVELLIKKKRNFYADPILDPIHYGFVASVERFIRLRKKFPNIKMFMGTGNLTELTDCDSSGANAIMMGMVSELSIDAVLVVQVSGHCKNSIRETDAARKIMYFSKKNQRLPFRVSNDLMCISERKPKRKSKEEIKEIKSMVKDTNYRIILSNEGINIFNKEISATGKDPYDFYEKVDIKGDSSHAFYLGVELARAQIAHQLGKNYDQDNQLEWGVAVEEKKVDLMNRPELKTTQKKKMILETIVSTINIKRKVNFAPFGIKKKSKNIIISPYIPSITLQNLKHNKCAVINYVDDASFYVNCILGNKKFKKKRTQVIDGFFLENSLSYDEVVVKKIIEDSVRPSFICEVVKSVSKKRYDGHNRAKAAIIEACILASRVKLLKKKKILDELNYLSIVVEKTAGNLEKKSWEKIRHFILNKINESK